MNLLQSHPQIFAQHETMGGAKRQNRDYGFIKEELDKFYSRREAQEANATGFKVLYEQMCQPLADYIFNKPLKKIILVRNDLLETALWTRVGTNYDARHENILVQYGKVTAHVDNIIDYIERLRLNIDFWLKKADFSLFYEGDVTKCGDNTKEFYNATKRAELLNFLGCDDRPIGTLSEKKRRLVYKSEDVVRNWNELLEEMDKRGISRYYSDTHR